MKNLKLILALLACSCACIVGAQDFHLIEVNYATGKIRSFAQSGTLEITNKIPFQKFTNALRPSLTNLVENKAVTRIQYWPGEKDRSGRFTTMPQAIVFTSDDRIVINASSKGWNQFTNDCANALELFKANATKRPVKRRR